MKNSISEMNSLEKQATKQNINDLNNLLSTSFLVCISISLIAVITGFVLLCLSGIDSIQLFISLDRIAAAVVLNLGILGLIITPFIQLLIALTKFCLNKDKIFVGISLLVLVFLSVSFVLLLN